MGGQTALNTALALAKQGILDALGVEMIGAKAEAIDKAEDRMRFRDAMKKIGLETPRSMMAHNMAEAMAGLEFVKLPAIIRPSFTMGGTGGGIAYNREEFIEIIERGLDASPTTQVLVEESVLGWKEFEMEVVRDKADNCIIVCSIENIDPMGVHTGDSITVAPALTLTDKEYQIMRDASLAVLREIGVETGGSNVQFAVNPADGRLVVIEMNPRVSRSSALASKATGFPIAKIAAKLAVGYTLDELENDITGGATPASFEPTIDYVVTKIPRFAFEKFPGADTTLTTAMKSVGEAMAIGRTFEESLQKALRSMETGLTGLDDIALEGLGQGDDRNVIRAALGPPDAGPPAEGRAGAAARRQRRGRARDVPDRPVVPRAHRRRSSPPRSASRRTSCRRGARQMRDAEGDGLLRCAAGQARRHRRGGGRARTARSSASCRSTSASTPARPSSPRRRAYMYSTYETPLVSDPPGLTPLDGAHGVDPQGRTPHRCESQPTDREKIIILGGGPNRIGQGIEFDYCCCHACFALSEAGFETIMVNCNPETVSTDYDTSDRLYFEPLTAEDVLEIIRTEQANGKLKGVIVQFGGQTPLKLAEALEAAGVPILGTSPDAIDLAEDRDRFKALIDKLGLRQPASGIARSPGEARAIAEAIGYPVVIRPSYVLGGRAHGDRARRQRGRPLRRAPVGDARQPVRAGRLRSPPAADRPLSDAMPSRSMSIASATARIPSSPASWSTSRRPASIPATAPARCRRIRSSDAMIERARGADARAGAGARRRRPDERAVRDQGRRHLHPRGQPARQPHGAVRRQGDRPAGGRHRRAHHGGQAAGRLRT